MRGVIVPRVRAGARALWRLAADVGALPAAGSWSGPDELTTAVGIVASGRLFKTAAGAPLDRASRAWRSSVSRRMCMGALQRWRALPEWARVRLMGVAVLAAALTDIVLRHLDPRPASPLRLWTWGAVALAGLTLAWHARAWTSAWRRRRERP